MAFKTAPFVQETTATTGTGAITCAGASSGYQPFSSFMSDGDTTHLIIHDGNGAKETSLATYTAGSNSLSRTLLASTTGSLLNLSGSATIFCGLPGIIGHDLIIAAQGIVPGGRLTATSGLATTIADVVGATSLYYTPDKHNIILLWDSTTSRWVPVVFPDTAIPLGTLASAVKGHDVFAVYSAGALSIELLIWTNSAARATALTVQDGRLCKSADKTRLWLGSFYPTSTTTTEDSLLNRLVFNAYNERERKLKANEATSHTINNTAAREWNNGTGARAYFFNGLQRDAARQFISVIMQTSTTSYAVAYPSLNGAAGEVDARFRLAPAPTAVDLTLNASVVHSPALGLNYLTVFEQEVVAADATFVAVTNEGVCRA